MATQALPGPEPQIEETYGRLAGIAMMLFAIFGCLIGMGLGATLIFMIKP